MQTRKPGMLFISSVLTIMAVLAAFASPAQAYFAPSNGQAATLVLGYSDFVTGNTQPTSQATFYAPAGVATDPVTHKVFVADYYNNRVLRFASLYSLANGGAAEAVLGQPNFTVSNPHTTRNGMGSAISPGPSSVFVDAGGRLWVADWGNDRVLRFDNAASKANGANADGVLGQPGFTSRTLVTTQNGMWYPASVFVDSAGRLWVTDEVNCRVLRFDNAAAKADGANADAVLGQPNFTSKNCTTTQNTMNWPVGLVVDSAGRLWVADLASNRVLRFDNAALKANGANADGELGQLNFTDSFASPGGRRGLNQPMGLSLENASGRLFVADTSNHRIMVFNAAAGLANDAPASFVLGQKGFVTDNSNNGGLSGATLWNPEGVFYDQTAKVLWAADSSNNRILMYGQPSRSFSARSSAAQDGWVIESSETSNAGGGLSTTGTLRVGDNALKKQFISVLSFDTSALPDTATLRSVTLKIKKAGAAGTDPFASFSPLLADIQNGAFGTNALEITDFQAPASASAIGHFVAIAAQPGWYQLVVPAADFSDVNLTGVTQFRLRFSLDDNNNLVADYDSFFAGDATAPTDRPVLSIEFTLP